LDAGTLEMNKVYEFWKNNSLNNIKPNRGGEFPEGWNVIEFFKNLYTKEEYGSVLDIGCGYGRLCKAFDPLNYLGIDFSKEAISQAKKLNPNYMFDSIKDSTDYPTSNTKLLYTVLLHQSDEDIDDIIKNLCESTRSMIIVAEICGRKWRRPGNPPVFNREKEEYIKLFAKHGRFIQEQYSEPYAAYKNTKIEIMVYT
jgi:SAM-dependent methyltransferase